ncbi:MAG: 6-bladed beta-propeller [Bacteroidales bacterium]|nr:6-bladed beta-propeller [Bacteroidales bacterium]
MKRIFYYMTVIMIAAGCGASNQNGNSNGSNCSTTVDGFTTMDIECTGGNKIAFKDLVDSVRVIVLDESTEDALIGRFVINIHKGGGRIIVEDDSDRPVKFFDANGKFIKSLRKGPGPGEVDIIEAECYNPVANEYIVYNGGTISVFDSDGNFKSKTNVPFEFGKMTCMNDDYLFYIFPAMANKDLFFSFVVTDKNFNIKFKALPYKHQIMPILGGPDSHYFRNFGNRVEFPNNDTIYSYDGTSLTPKSYISYSEKRTYEEISKRVLTVYASDGVTQLVHVTSNDPYEWFQMVRNEKTGHSFAYQCDDDNYDDDSDLYFWTQAMEDGDMCMIIGSPGAVKVFLRSIADKLTPTQKSMFENFETKDQHTLVLFKFKDF